MKSPLVSVCFFCFFVTSAFAAVMSEAPVLSKGAVVQAPESPLSSPTKAISPETKTISSETKVLSPETKTLSPAVTRPQVPAIAPTKRGPAKLPGIAPKSRTSPIAQPGISPLIKPMQATQPPQSPIIESISFDGYDSIGNLKWMVRIHNNHATEFTAPLWIGTQQCKTIQAGAVCNSASYNISVTARPLAPGQQTQVVGSFVRLAEMTRLKVRLTNGPTTLQEMESPLPPELTYQAQVVGVTMTTNAAAPLQISIQNTGANAIPSLSVQKLCAHSATPNTFVPCGGSGLNNILPSQTVTSDQPLPLGWPTNPNIMKVRISRGSLILDEEMFYPQ